MRRGICWPGWPTCWKMSRRLGKTGCAAGRGTLPQTDPALARAMAHESMAHVEELVPTVSGCPTCGYHLSQSGHPVRDLLDVLCDAIG